MLSFRTESKGRRSAAAPTGIAYKKVSFVLKAANDNRRPPRSWGQRFAYATWVILAIAAAVLILQSL